VQQIIKCLSKNACLQKNDVQSFTIVVTANALKLGYASVIFVDTAVQINETQLSSFTTVAVCHMQGSGSSYLSKTMAQCTQNMVVYSIRISQDSVAMHCGCGAILLTVLVIVLSQSLPVKEL